MKKVKIEGKLLSLLRKMGQEELDQISNSLICANIDETEKSSALQTIINKFSFMSLEIGLVKENKFSAWLNAEESVVGRLKGYIGQLSRPTNYQTFGGRA